MWSPYQYGANNPVFYNDPLGDKEREAQPVDVIGELLGSGYGGTWNNTGGSGFFSYFGDPLVGFYEGASYMAATNSWGSAWDVARGYDMAAARLHQTIGITPAKEAGGYVSSIQFFYDKGGRPTTINGVSGQAVATYVGGEANKGGYEQSETSKFFTSNELGYSSAPLGPVRDFLESAQRVGGRYLASPGGRVSQRLLRTGEITLRTAAGNINTSAKLVNGIRVGAKWGGNILGAVGVGFTLERLANDPTYHLWGEGGLDLAFGAAGFIPVYGWAISGTYSVGKAIYEYNKEK